MLKASPSQNARLGGRRSGFSRRGAAVAEPLRKEIKMEECLKYYAAACQTDLPSPLNRAEMKRNTERILRMIDHAVVGYAPFMPVKLVVFPEFSHAAPAYLSVVAVS